eukprot:9715260-Alexandrium_andersonii.AAC.1
MIREMVNRVVRGPTPNAASPRDESSAEATSGLTARPAGGSQQPGSLPVQAAPGGTQTRGP